MNELLSEKDRKVASKSFMTVGPTLHYSHKNVQRCWLLAVVVFAVTTAFWSKILTGSFWSFGFQGVMSPHFWRLDQTITTGVSIFEYPWQILVLGLLMGILAVVPVLISQLMSFSYCVPFILAVVFLANLPGFGVCVLISCVAAACRPLRFRSRFIAIALCTAPQLLYWGCFGGARGVEPIKWGFSFAPWICAWLVGLGIAALVLGIGHFTRYRPGLVWLVSTVFLVPAVITFEMRIGFDELDYQLYVARNNPQEVGEFHNHSITEALDRTITNPAVRKFFLAGLFYPAEPNLLRAKLKGDIQIQIRQGRWPSWFMKTPELKFYEKKQWLFNEYMKFITRRPNSRRMPIALYYKAILSEYSPDIKLLGQKELLHFYSDYAHDRSSNIWWTLYADFPDSTESIEARWRIAKNWAGLGRFKQADRLISQAKTLAADRLKLLQKQNGSSETLLSPFQPPADSVMTKAKLEDLQRRLNHLQTLIGLENRTDQPDAGRRLAGFVMLNPHTLVYAQQLDKMLAQMDDKAPLRDNVLLARAKLIADQKRRAKSLTELHNEFRNSDGGMQALYELGRLKIGLYQDQSDPERKKQCLADARATLTGFINLYPDGFWADQVRKILEELPAVD